ncbi:MAG: DUF6438 domain-containing protein [Terracidiphilus sp.]|nr:DUF6438 domain-containing protein [Terracidiphilus sp.]
MKNALLAGLLLFSCGMLAAQTPAVSTPIDAKTARTHEIGPHRHYIPMKGIGHGYHELELTLQISAEGKVVNAKADGDANLLALWPMLKPEVMSWRYRPFEQEGYAVPVTVLAGLQLVPPEQLPMHHVQPPAVKPDSVVSIALSKTECYGTCPSFTVELKTTGGIAYFGRSYVVKKGVYEEKADPDAIRALARKLIAADFYSMDDEYRAMVTDLPTTTLSITIDGREKHVEDYAGLWTGMPVAVKELEDEVYEFSGARKWVEGNGSEQRRR